MMVSRQIFLSSFIILFSFLGLFRSRGAFLASPETYISIASYTEFLNEEATEEGSLLYNPLLAEDPTVAHIYQEGTPGNYSYSYIEEEADFPVSYLSLYAERFYNEWDTETIKTSNRRCYNDASLVKSPETEYLSENSENNGSQEILTTNITPTTSNSDQQDSQLSSREKEIIAGLGAVFTCYVIYRGYQYIERMNYEDTSGISDQATIYSQRNYPQRPQKRCLQRRYFQTSLPTIIEGRSSQTPEERGYWTLEERTLEQHDQLYPPDS